MCNEYDISTGVCPGTVQYKKDTSNKELSILGSKDGLSCSAESVNKFTEPYLSCKPRGSFVLKHIDVYIELNEEDLKR